jgi:hypothetical protein
MGRPDSAPAAIAPASRLVTVGRKTTDFRDSTGLWPPSSRRCPAVGPAAASLVTTLGTVFVLVVLFLLEAAKLKRR